MSPSASDHHPYNDYKFSISVQESSWLYYRDFKYIEVDICPRQYSATLFNDIHIITGDQVTERGHWICFEGVQVFHKNDLPQLAAALASAALA